MPREIPQASGPNPIRDPRVLEVIQRLNATRRHPQREAFDGPSRHDSEAFADYRSSAAPNSH